MQITANQPAIATLQSKSTDISSAYDTLLKSIMSAEQPALNTATSANSANMAARGIDPNSPYAQTSLANAQLPITTATAQQEAGAGVQEQTQLTELAGNIASLQAGNVPGALSFGAGAAGAGILPAQAGLLGAQGTAARYVPIPGYGVYDTTTGQLIGGLNGVPGQGVTNINGVPSIFMP